MFDKGTKGFILTSILAILICSSLYAQNTPRTIHVFVALCDNVHQGIVPVSKTLGNGEDPRNNLYWGALYGVKTFFRRSENWELISTKENPTSEIMERCIFKHQSGDVYLIADAYRGREIRKATDDFFQAASGNNKEFISVEADNEQVSLGIGGNSELIAYVGHDGLMDFDLDNYPSSADNQSRQVIILACASRQFYCEPLENTGAKPLLLTTGLMAPEAYTLESAVEGWILNEGDEEIRLRAADAYREYQKCGIRAASNLFSTNCNK